jgi:hypothetical protein
MLVHATPAIPFILSYCEFNSRDTRFRVILTPDAFYDQRRTASVCLKARPIYLAKGIHGGGQRGGSSSISTAVKWRTSPRSIFFFALTDHVHDPFVPKRVFARLGHGAEIL